MLLQDINVLFVYYYSRNISLQLERGGFADTSYPNTSISKIIDLIGPVVE